MLRALAPGHPANPPDLPDSLQRAILYFICSCAARRARGQGGEHMTMLIHTSARVRMHESVAALIEGWLACHGEEISQASTEIRGQMETIWKEEEVRSPAELAAEAWVAFKDLVPHLSETVAALSVPVENGSSEDRIDYTDVAKTYIVVGGSILARGLTLEGLSVSYFLRTSNQYDTLLQMGRWFGYREGYADLARVWMPNELQLRFRALAAIEAEIREDISVYSGPPPITPMEFAVRIRSIPGMAITARAKMRHAQRCSIGFWGRHVQTIRFQRKNDVLLDSNWDAAGRLMDAVVARGKDAEIAGRRVWLDVPNQVVTQFLREYAIDPSHQDLSSEHLLAFLEQDRKELTTWNVGLISSAEGELSARALGGLGRVRTVNRSRLTSSPDETADIKALMSRQDAAFDCPQGTVDVSKDWEQIKVKRRQVVGERPLLLLYPIDRSSPARRDSKLRVPLNAPRDVLGFAIVVPLSRDHGGNYVSVVLQPPSAEEIEAMEAEELAATEAAGID
jgi:hypothetical protein